MKLDVGCDFEYETAVPTPAIFLVRPLPSEPQQFVLEERWETEPSAPFHDYIDGFGNICRRATIGAGLSTLSYDALLEVPDDKDPAWTNTFIYLVAHPSQQEAKKNCHALHADPAFPEYRNQAAPIIEKVGDDYRVDEVYMRPTDYSAMK